MRTALSWLLWLWIASVIYAGLVTAPLAMGFTGLEGGAPQSSRIVFFHVPLAVSSFIAFLGAGVWSALYLWRREERHDRSAHAAVEVGLLFCFLATVTGAVWGRVQWGSYWNWDIRQTSITLALVFYLAYLTLRNSFDDPEVRARIAASYAVLGLAVAPFLYFILPRMASFSLHPKPAGAEMDPAIGYVVIAGILGFTALFFWMHDIRRRILVLEATSLRPGEATMPRAVSPDEP